MCTLSDAYRLACAVEADDDDGKFVLPMNYIQYSIVVPTEVANLVKYSWRPLRRWYMVAFAAAVIAANALGLLDKRPSLGLRRDLR